MKIRDRFIPLAYAGMRREFYRSPQQPLLMLASLQVLQIHQNICGQWPQTIGRSRSCSTIFFPWTTVVISFALAEYFQGWVTSNIKLLCELSFSSGIDFSQGNGRRALAELLGSLLVLWSKPFAVPTPREGEVRAVLEDTSPAVYLLPLKWNSKVFQNEETGNGVIQSTDFSLGRLVSSIWS